MKSGYEIFWTDHATLELKETIHFLESNWSQKEVINFIQRLENVVSTLSKTPFIYQSINENNSIRQAVVTKHNKLFYRILDDKIELLSLFSVRQNQNKIKLKN